MKRRSFAAIGAVAAMMLTAGCGTFHKMPFDVASDKVEDKKAVYLLMVTLDNAYRSSFKPRLQSVVLDRRNGDKWEAMLLNADVSGEVVVPGAAVNSYAARMELAPGDYRLRALNANHYAVLMNSTFTVPMFTPLKVTEPRGVFYLGHLRGTLREAKPGDLSAIGIGGGLIAQEVSGAASGTFDVVIGDAWRTDEAIFRTQFPALANVPVRKALLPAYDRARVAREVAAAAGK